MCHYSCIKRICARSVATNAAVALRASDSPNCRKKHLNISVRRRRKASVQVPLENMIRRNQNSISLTSIAQTESIAQKALFGFWLWIQYRCRACNCCCCADGTAAPTFCANLLQIVRDQIQLIDNAKHFAVSGPVVCKDKNNWKLRGTSICTGSEPGKKFLIDIEVNSSSWLIVRFIGSIFSR